jgi:hypothetical protein
VPRPPCEVPPRPSALQIRINEACRRAAPPKRPLFFGAQTAGFLGSAFMDLRDFSFLP